MPDYDRDKGHYVATCDECGSNIIRDCESDNQVGRCNQCGHHEIDNQFHHSATKELDFND